MATPKMIKVIKRDQRIASEAAANAPKRAHETNPIRETAATVANWVSEFKQKKEQERTETYSDLLKEVPQEPREMRR